MIYFMYDKARRTYYKGWDKVKGPVKTLQTFSSPLTAARLFFNQRINQPPVSQANCKRTTFISWQLGSSWRARGVKGRSMWSVSWRGKSWATLCWWAALVVRRQQGSVVERDDSELWDIRAKIWFQRRLVVCYNVRMFRCCLFLSIH